MEDTIITPTTATVLETSAPKRPRGRPRKVVGAPSVASPVSSSVVASVSPVAPARARIEKTVQKVEKSVVSHDAPTVAHAASSKPLASSLAYIFCVGRRKRAVARVFMYKEGKGEIEVNGKPMAQYFATTILQDMVRGALAQSPFQKSVRVVAQVSGGGLSGQAEAIRLGTARALLTLDETLRPSFRARGFVTRDPREKERKKPGLKRARRGPQWAKR